MADMEIILKTARMVKMKEMEKMLQTAKMAKMVRMEKMLETAKMANNYQILGGGAKKAEDPS